MTTFISGFEMIGGIDLDDELSSRPPPARPFDHERWLTTLTPDAAADMRAIIEAPNPRLRAHAVGLARDHGRGWRNIATAITVNELQPPAY